MDPHWVPIWEQNAVQNVVAQLPVGSPGADRAPKAFRHTQGLIFIALGVRSAGLGPLWVSVSLALDLDFVDMVSIFWPAHTSLEGPGACPCLACAKTIQTIQSYYANGPGQGLC